MHFSKTYAQILLTLPPDLRDKAISYRQLKKLINRVVQELTALGFSPTILHDLIGQDPQQIQYYNEEAVPLVVHSFPSSVGVSPLKVTYEVDGDVNHLSPHLRLSITGQAAADCPVLLTSLLSAICHPQDSLPNMSDAGANRELIIPLPSDAAFFHLLANTLGCLSTHLDIVQSNFMLQLDSLSKSICHHARPMSSIPSGFKAYSQSANPAAVSVPSMRSIFRPVTRSDLYKWREFFRLYVEAEIFETVNELHRGERSVEDAERRLLRFLGMVYKSNVHVGKGSRRNDNNEDIETFIQLNTLILNLKKFNQANSEAIRKILKKHSKRTALPFPPSLYLGMEYNEGSLHVAREVDPFVIRLFTDSYTSLPRLLVQAIGEVLLPVVPHLDDYSCPICTSIAFKPIRLACGHLFCVRCLVKMQKRGKNNCPLCRSPTVLTADRTNVDWALLNFMNDWFPIESREKLTNNEREAAKEEAEDLGMSDGCVIV